LRILLDQNLFRGTAALLRTLGHDALHTGEAGAARTRDIDIIALALAEDRIIATRDTDFHQLIATRSLTGPSTILIRVPEFTEYTLATLIDDICKRYSEALMAGSLITANGRTIRVRSLPLSSNEPNLR